MVHMSVYADEYEKDSYIRDMVVCPSEVCALYSAFSTRVHLKVNFYRRNSTLNYSTRERFAISFPTTPLEYSIILSSGVAPY